MGLTDPVHGVWDIAVLPVQFCESKIGERKKWGHESKLVTTKTLILEPSLNIAVFVSEAQPGLCDDTLGELLLSVICFPIFYI